MSRSIRRKLGVVVCSLGLVTLSLITLTYWTFDGLDDDNRREAIARSQETSVFHQQLLAMSLLRGHDARAHLALEERAYEDLLRRLLERDTTDEQQEDRRLIDAWMRYRDATAAVVAANDALVKHADGALGDFSPWLASLNNLEASVDPSADEYEDELALIAECRSASNSLNSSFLKLTSATPGDSERQARLSMSVAAETITDLLATLEDQLSTDDAPNASQPSAPDAMRELQEAWVSLRASLDAVVESKAELGRRVGPSAGLNLEQAFNAIMVEQRRALQHYEALSANRKSVLSGILTLSAIAAVLLALAAAWVVERSVVHPLRKLTEGTTRFADGALGARIAVDSVDEFGALAAAFNSMAERIAASHRELEIWADTLELQVHDRTEALRRANVRLVKEGEQRAQMEEQLRLAQKLESVAQLAAGLAHELNTPIQFIGDNVRFLQGLVAKIGPIAECSARLANASRTGPDPQAAEELLRLLEAADLAFLLPESQSAVTQSIEGIDQVAKIVRAMKEFSRPPGAERKSLTDLRQSIESTVMVAANKWRSTARVSLELDDDVPFVECFPGEINQVLLNVIVNAADAIAESGAGKTAALGEIRISLSRVGDRAEIRVADTGVGIPEAIRDRVFDQFFSTKDVGKGAGQGLSVAHSVVVGRHGGTIHFESEVGKGTVFVIRLPFAASTHQAQAA